MLLMQGDPGDRLLVINVSALWRMIKEYGLLVLAIIILSLKF